MSPQDAQILQQMSRQLQANIENVARQLEVVGQAMKTYTADQTQKVVMLERRIQALENATDTRTSADPQPGSIGPSGDGEESDPDFP